MSTTIMADAMNSLWSQPCLWNQITYLMRGGASASDTLSKLFRELFIIPFLEYDAVATLLPVKFFRYRYRIQNWKNLE